MSQPIPELNAPIELVADLSTELGEGPIWDAASNTLIFVDSIMGRIYRFSPLTGAMAQIDVGPMLGAAIPRKSGGIVASSVDGLLAIEETGSSRLLAAVEQDRPNNRMNDAKCDSRGRLLSGTFSQPFQKGANALYRIDGDLRVHTLVTNVTVSNGIAWSPSEDTLYYVDTASRGVDCFDYDIDSGEIANRRRFANIDKVDGFPDGITVDAEGCVWVALYLGGKVRRYAPDGSIVSQLTVPVSGVTSCNFGGEALTDLYITSARHGVSAEKLATEPHGGGLFRCSPGVAGLPSHSFAG